MKAMSGCGRVLLASEVSTDLVEGLFAAETRKYWSKVGLMFARYTTAPEARKRMPCIAQSRTTPTPRAVICYVGQVLGPGIWQTPEALRESPARPSGRCFSGQWLHTHK